MPRPLGTVQTKATAFRRLIRSLLVLPARQPVFGDIGGMPVATDELVPAALDRLHVAVGPSASSLVVWLSVVLAASRDLLLAVEAQGAALLMSGDRIGRH